MFIYGHSIVIQLNFNAKFMPKRTVYDYLSGEKKPKKYPAGGSCRVPYKNMLK
jgi:hypothetical protein